MTQIKIKLLEARNNKKTSVLFSYKESVKKLKKNFILYSFPVKLNKENNTDTERSFSESFITSENFGFKHEEENFAMEANITTLKVKAI